MSCPWSLSINEPTADVEDGPASAHKPASIVKYSPTSAHESAAIVEAPLVKSE